MLRKLGKQYCICHRKLPHSCPWPPTWLDRVGRDRIGSKELDTYVEAYSQPAAMQASFGWFRAFGAVSAFNQSYTTKKLTVPVLALGGRQNDEWVYGSADAKRC